MDGISGTPTASADARGQLPGPSRAGPGQPRWPGWLRSPAWLCYGLPLLILAFLTGNVLAHGPLVSLDQQVRLAVLPYADAPGYAWLVTPPFGPAWLLTSLGETTVAIPVLAAAAVIAAVRARSWRPLLTALVAAVALLATVIPAKILIGRPGPGIPAVSPGSMGAFPSGHTSTACVCSTVAVLLLATGLRGWARRAAAAAVVVLWLLVGAALVWSDFHWFTDVAAGWALSALIVQFAVWLAERRQASPSG